jgi:dipeptidase E
MRIAERRIVAMGGRPDPPLVDYVLGLTGAERPRALWVGTASAETAEGALLAYDLFGHRAQVSRLEFFPWPPRDLSEAALGSDVIVIGGGNTANMLAIWRVHGFDRVLREAWEQGVVLCGWSAGMICWFEAGVTDSFGPQLEGMRDGLAFLPGSACPHYDGEERRRPVYRSLVDAGFPSGFAADDSVGLVYEGTELVEVVTARDGATAYRVEAGSEVALAARLL